MKSPSTPTIHPAEIRLSVKIVDLVMDSSYAFIYQTSSSLMESALKERVDSCPETAQNLKQFVDTILTLTYEYCSSMTENTTPEETDTPTGPTKPESPPPWATYRPPGLSTATKSSPKTGSDTSSLSTKTLSSRQTPFDEADEKRYKEFEEYVKASIAGKVH